MTNQVSEKDFKALRDSTRDAVSNLQKELRAVKKDLEDTKRKLAKLEAQTAHVRKIGL